jgi:hypothetical protein
MGMFWSRGALILGAVLTVLAIATLTVVISNDTTLRANAAVPLRPAPDTAGDTTGPGATAAPTTAPVTPTATPGPTVTRTPTRRPSSVTGSSGGKPTSSNTGVPAGVSLRVVSGDQVYTKDNQVVSGVDIRGYVRIRAKNVTIKNSIVRGGAPRCNAAVIFVERGQSATIQDTDVVASRPNACLDGIWAENATLLRLDIRNVVDGVKAFNNVTLRDSYIHDLSYFASDPNQGGGATHNDAVQTYEGNRNVTLRHNNLTVGRQGNAAYQVTQDGGKVASNLRIEDNWLDGGGCTLNFSHKGGPTPMTGIYVVNNRFGRNSVFNCPILLSTGTKLSQNSGNVWVDTGGSIPRPQQHD